MKKFIFLPHTGDIKFQAFGKSLGEVFENSALAFINSQYKDKIKEKIKKKIKVRGKDNEALLYNFLEEILFLIDTEGFLTGNCNVKISKDKKSLVAELIGDDIKNYRITIDAKAVTYNEMFVKQDLKKKKWIAQVVVDV